MIEKIISIINSYLRENETTTFNTRIGSYVTTRCLLHVSINPNHLRIEHYDRGFEIIIHSNKNLIKVKSMNHSNRMIYRSEYNYIAMLYHILEIRNWEVSYYPFYLKEKIYGDLIIYNRDKTIEQLL